jgi:hypothetical protein
MYTTAPTILLFLNTQILSLSQFIKSDKESFMHMFSDDLLSNSFTIVWLLNNAQQPPSYTCSLPLWRVHEIERMYLASRTHDLYITVPDRRSRILEVIIVRRLATWVLGIWRGESWERDEKGEVSLQAT